MICKLDTVVGEHYVDGVRNGCDQITKKRCSGHFPGFHMQFDVDKLRGAIDGHKQIQLPFRRLNLGNVPSRGLRANPCRAGDVKIANRVGFELLLRRFVTINIRQSTDVVTLQATMQR